MRSFREYLIEKEENLNEGVGDWLKKAGMILALIGSLSGCAYPANAQEIDPMPTNAIVKTVENKTGVDLTASQVENVIEKLEDGKKEEAKKFVYEYVNEWRKGIRSGKIKRNPEINGVTDWRQDGPTGTAWADKKNPRYKGAFGENFKAYSCNAQSVLKGAQHEEHLILDEDQMEALFRQGQKSTFTNSKGKEIPVIRKDNYVNNYNIWGSMCRQLLKDIKAGKDWKDANAEWRNPSKNYLKIVKILNPEDKINLDKTDYDFFSFKIKTPMSKTVNGKEISEKAMELKKPIKDLKGKLKFDDNGHPIDIDKGHHFISGSDKIGEAPWWGETMGTRKVKVNDKDVPVGKTTKSWLDDNHQNYKVYLFKWID